MSANTEEWFHRHRLTVEEFERMAEVGLLAHDARVELIEGEIIDMPPSGDPHSGTINFLNRAFSAAVGTAAIVSVQLPLRLGQYSQPQPDLIILRDRRDFYAAKRPTSPDTLLLIEVSDSSVRYDRQIKLPLYAKHGVREYWLIDVSKKELHRFRSPQLGGYADVSSTKSPGILTVDLPEPTQVDLTRLFDL